MTDTMSPADIKAITGNNNNDGFMNGNGAWWIIILFLFAFTGGWGRGGFGGGGMTGGGVTDGYVLSSDFANIERKIDGVNNGLCDGFYSTAQLINGVNMQNANNTAAIQNTLTQGFAGLNTGMIQQGYETRLGINGIGQQMANCCCEIREGISGVNYNNALANAGLQKQIGDTGFGIERQLERGFCDNGYALATNTNAIVQNAHNDADRIIARIDKMESDRLQERITQLTADNNALRFHNSQVEQNAYLVDKLGYHCPQAAYVVQPPQQVTFPTNCCGGVNYASANGGCGC